MKGELDFATTPLWKNLNCWFWESFGGSVGGGFWEILVKLLGVFGTFWGKLLEGFGRKNSQNLCCFNFLKISLLLEEFRGSCILFLLFPDFSQSFLCAFLASHSPPSQRPMLGWRAPVAWTLPPGALPPSLSPQTVLHPIGRMKKYNKHKLSGFLGTDLAHNLSEWSSSDSLPFYQAFAG